MGVTLTNPLVRDPKSPVIVEEMKDNKLGAVCSSLGSFHHSIRSRARKSRARVDPFTYMQLFVVLLYDHDVVDNIEVIRVVK